MKTQKFQTVATQLVVGLLVMSGGVASAKGDSYAYMASPTADFGIVDLDTGVFTLCGNSGLILAGLGLGADGTIYTAASDGFGYYSVDPRNGKLTSAGDTSARIWAFGSTAGGSLYALDANTNLYSVSGAGGTTLIGPTGIVPAGGLPGVSAGAPKLYITWGTTLYVVNTQTARARAIGTEVSGFGGFVQAHGTLYGGANNTSPPSIYRVNKISGADTLVAPLQGEIWGFAGLVPAPKNVKGNCRK
jgi:hypothetical protein